MTKDELRATLNRLLLAEPQVEWSTDYEQKWGDRALDMIAYYPDIAKKYMQLSLEKREKLFEGLAYELREQARDRKTQK